MRLDSFIIDTWVSSTPHNAVSRYVIVFAVGLQFLFVRPSCWSPVKKLPKLGPWYFRAFIYSMPTFYLRSRQSLLVYQSREIKAHKNYYIRIVFWPLSFLLARRQAALNKKSNENIQVSWQPISEPKFIHWCLFGGQCCYCYALESCSLIMMGHYRMVVYCLFICHKSHYNIHKKKLSFDVRSNSSSHVSIDFSAVMW